MFLTIFTAMTFKPPPAQSTILQKSTNFLLASGFVLIAQFIHHILMVLKNAS